MKTKKTAERLTSMELAIRYGVSMSLLNQWRRFEGFPSDASQRIGSSLMWNPVPIDAWLRKRLAQRGEVIRGPKPMWADVVTMDAA